MVVANSASLTSRAIAEYYAQQNGIPSANLIYITCPTSEQTDWNTFASTVRDPLRAVITGLESGGAAIDYIVLTKGIPLSVSRDVDVYSSASVLTCLSQPDVDAPIVNPYGPTTNDPGGYNGLPASRAFSHSLALFGYHLYLVSRIDAYSVAQAERIVDDRASARPGGAYVFDRRPGFQLVWKTMDDRLGGAASILRARGLNVVEDNTATFLSGQTDVMGYFGWGSNDASYTLGAYESNVFRPGSIGDTYVSTSGRTFNPTSGGQSLLADLIPQGLSAGGAYVAEPYGSLTDYPNVVCDRYTQGYNAVESFYASCPELFWRTVIIGDPLMAPYSTPPVVNLTLPAPGAVSGDVTLQATATDASGIQKVEFYCDDVRIAVDYQPPYTAVINSFLFDDGSHRVEAIAYENSAVAAQGRDSRLIDIENPGFVPITQPSQLLTMPVGTYAELTGAVVTIGNVTGSGFWVSARDGTSGIEVTGAFAAKSGDIVDVKGLLYIQDGRQKIQQLRCTKTGATTPAVPVAVEAPDLGGVSPFPDNVPSGGTSGAYNVGRSVQVAGFVDQTNPSAGSMTLAGTQWQPAVTIYFANPTPASKALIPLPGKYVRVRGVCSTTVGPSGVSATVLAESWSAVSPVAQLTWHGPVGKGTNLLGLPFDPQSADPAQVFVITAAGSAPIDGNLFWWSAAASNWVVYYQDPFSDPFPSPSSGGVYMMRSSVTAVCTFVGFDPAAGCDLWVSLGSKAGRAAPVALRGVVEAPWSSCLVTDGFMQLPIDQAIAVGWLKPEGQLFQAGSSNYSSFLLTSASPVAAGQGYFVYPKRPNLSLVIPAASRNSLFAAN